MLIITLDSLGFGCFGLDGIFYLLFWGVLFGVECVAGWLLVVGGVSCERLCLLDVG